MTVGAACSGMAAAGDLVPAGAGAQEHALAVWQRISGRQQAVDDGVEVGLAGRGVEAEGRHSAPAQRSEGVHRQGLPGREGLIAHDDAVVEEQGDGVGVIGGEPPQGGAGRFSALARGGMVLGVQASGLGGGLEQAQRVFDGVDHG